MVDKGAVKDIFETVNDSIGLVRIRAAEEKSFGSLTINLDNLDSAKYYVLQLISNAGAIVEKKSINNKSRLSISFTFLDPASYSIRLIEDNNRNQRWDTGNYELHIQPERIFIKVLPPLRANWEQTIDFNL